MDAVDPEIRDEMLRYMSKELKAVREQLEEERRKTRASGTPTGATKVDESDVSELREENEAQQKRLEILEEENARLWHHVARFESGEEDKPIALDVSRSDDRHARLFELYYMPKDQYEAHCAKLSERLRLAKEKRDLARDEANAAKERATEAELNAENYRQKYKDLKNDIKLIRPELSVAQDELQDYTRRIKELEEANREVVQAAAGLKPAMSRFNDVSHHIQERLEEFMDGGIEKINPLDEQELSGRSPVCALRERSNGRGFEFPEDFQHRLRHNYQLWSVRNTRFSSFFDDSMSRAMFLAPSHELTVRSDGSTIWHSSFLSGFDATNGLRQIFYKSGDDWRYLGLHRLAFFGELHIHELKDLRGLSSKILASKCMMNKSMVPPIVARQVHQLIDEGAIRVLCLAFEKVEDDDGMSEALRSLPGAPRHPLQTHPEPAALTAASGSKRSFTGPPVPIPKPGQSSSAPSTSKSRKKRHRKESTGSAPGSKNKKQKTRAGS